MAGAFLRPSKTEVGGGQETLMADHNLVDKRTLDAEVALTMKVKEIFPDLEEEVVMKIVPDLIR